MKHTIALPVQMLDVVDGDTLRATVCLAEYVRVAGVDAPEMRTPAQRAAAEVVTAAVRRWLACHPEARIVPLAYDKYGQRIVANVEAGDGSQLSTWLLNQGLAHPYDGSRKVPWTDAELTSIEQRRGEFLP